VVSEGIERKNSVKNREIDGSEMGTLTVVAITETNITSERLSTRSRVTK